MTTNAEDHGVPPVPDGHYAVRDPYWSGWTFWEAIGGALRDWPCRKGVRWRPVPPPFPDLQGEERAAARHDWYESTYWPWRREVAELVLADLDGAAAEFAARSGSVKLPDPPDWGTRPPRVPRPKRAPRVAPGAKSESASRRRRAEEALLALALRSAGSSVRQIAASMGVPKSTVGRRLTEQADRTTSDVVARALLALRANDLEATYQAGGQPGDAQREKVLDEIRKIREVLRDGGPA